MAVNLPGSAKARRDAVDRQQQRRQRVVLPRPVTPQQVDLLSIHLIEHRQPAGEPPPELRKPLRQLGAPGKASYRVHRAVILVRHEREDLGAYPVVGDQPGVVTGDVEVDVRERLLHHVQDETKQAEGTEHAPQQRRSAGAPHVHERREDGADAVPPRDEVPVLCPREHPRNGPQVCEGAGSETAGRPGADVQQGDLFERARRLKVADEARMLDQAAVGGVRRPRERLHRFVEFGRGHKRLLPLGLERVLRSEEHTSELQSHHDLVCRLLLEKKKKIKQTKTRFIKKEKKKKTKKKEQYITTKNTSYNSKNMQTQTLQLR